MKQLPIHPKNRKNRIIKKEEIDTNYDKSTVVLPTNHSVNLKRLKKKRKTINKTNVKPISKKVKQEMLDKYYKDQNENVEFVTQKPIHPRYRKIKSQPKIKIDKSAKKYLKKSEFDIKFNSIQNLSRNDRTERIMDILISKFPSDNNDYSIKHDPRTDTFTIYRDV